MSLTPADLENIEAIVDRVVDRKLDEKLDQRLPPIFGELTALRADIKAIYHMLKRKQDKSAAKREYSRLETMIPKSV
jgi:Skp family chaperone for outer membrane proteins